MAKELVNYKINSVLGKGGFGTVYSGVRIEDSLPVAIKEIPVDTVSQWFYPKLNKKNGIPLEIFILQKVSTIKGVVKMIEWFENFVTMDEYQQGKDTNSTKRVAFIVVMERPAKCVDLFDYLGDSILKEDVAQKFFKEVFTIIKDCFDMGVVHRDIKDENIIVTLNDRNEPIKLTVIDFGSAAFVQENEFRTFEGTKVFAPPEYFKSGTYDGELVTVWSLGLLLFSMVTGSLPWEDENDIADASELDIWFPKGVNLSKECHDLIRACLTIDTSSRATFKDIYNMEWMK
jgi:serine/threonine protein kinase